MASTISAGTTAGTAIVVSGDTSGSLVLQTNGTTTAVTIDTSQNVGIGTSSPATKLHLLTASATAVALRAGNSASYAEFQVDASGNSQLIAPGGVQIFNTNGAERMRIDSSGNVGIGTSSPGNKLEVNGSFYQYNAYATVGSFNAGTLGTSPSSGTGLGISTNITNGQAEIDLWNTVDPASYANTGILFTQRLTSSTRRDLMFLHNNGNLQFNSGYGSVATAYGCRAWVNFNGTGTVAIRASGNVSSITDNGTGDYTVNFTTNMPDANYCWSMGGDGSGARLNTWGYAKTNVTAPTTSALRVLFNDDQSTSIDTTYACVKIHR